MKLDQEVATINTSSSPNKDFTQENQLGDASAVAAVAPPPPPVAVEETRAQVMRFIREGIVAAKAGDLPVARKTLQQAIGLDENNETALMWLASISDKPHELLGYLQRVLALNPANERAAQWAKSTKLLLAKSLIQQGAASHKEGMPEIAAQYFLQATEYDPANETAWLWLVSVSSEPEDKLSYLNRILQLNPQHEKALALFHKTKTQIARSLLKKGNAAAIAGDHDTAREILRDVMEYNSKLEEAWLLKAFLSNLPEEKIVCFEKALEINPESEQAKAGLAALQMPSEAEPLVDDSPIEEPTAMGMFSESAASTEVSPELPSEFASEEQFVGEKYVEVPNADEASVEEQLKAAAMQEEAVQQEKVAAAPDPFIVTANFAADAEVSQATRREVMVACPFCQTENPASAHRCNGCGAFTRLEDFDQLLNNELYEESRMRDFIQKLQQETAGREPSASEHFGLGLAYLNLRNVKKAVGHFESVLRLDIDNDGWNSQITPLLDYVKEKMPELLGNNASKSGKTIMVVDDSPTVRKLIANKLEKYGHAVVAAIDGMDALSKINETVPDLILLDVTMPRLDGYQLCKLVKSNVKTKHVPVVMISGKDGFFDKVRGRMAGSTAYITKPFGPETLLQTVETYCK